MRRSILFLLWTALATAETRYEIDVARAGSRTVAVGIEAECAKAECDFQMPVWNATYQVRDFAQYVSRFEAARATGQALRWRLVGPSRWRVEAAGERVRVRYQYLAEIGRAHV